MIRGLLMDLRMPDITDRKVVRTVAVPYLKNKKGKKNFDWRQPFISSFHGINSIMHRA